MGKGSLSLLSILLSKVIHAWWDLSVHVVGWRADSALSQGHVEWEASMNITLSYIPLQLA